MSENPLKQYFRRPAIYLKLPSNGQGYPPGVIDMPESGDLPIYPMTAIDEITARTPDALFNGTAVVEIIKSCIPSIKDPWTMFSTDLDAALIAIKAASNGNDLEMESECPKCKETGKYGINLAGMLTKLTSGDYTVELNVNDLYFKFRPLYYKEMNDINLKQFEVQKNMVITENDSEEVKAKKNQETLRLFTDITIDVISKTIEYIKTPVGIVRDTTHIADFLRNCDRITFNKLRDYSIELKDKTEMPPLDISCVNCSHPYSTKFTLNVTDFFG
jgi:hypothetical protein